MKSDTENYMISSWLMGEHTNDLQYFVPGDFSNGNNPDIVRMLQANFSNLEVSRQYDDDYRGLVGLYAPSVYEAAFAEAAESVRWRWVTSDASIQDISKVIHILDDRLNGISTAPIIQRDLLATWTRDKEELRQNGQCTYGIRKLDFLTGGIFKGHLVTIAGRPADGKSALALQIASHVASHERKKVIYFTLEMSITEQLDRLLMQRVGVEDAYRLKQGDIDLVEGESFRKEIEKVEHDQLLLFSTDRIVERIESVIVTESPFMVVIDQLTQLQFSNRLFSNDLERYKALTRHLKALTNTTGITILLLCQLNRTAEGKEPALNHLKDSGSIEEDSDDVLMIYKPPGTEQYEVSDLAAPSFRCLKIAKQRSGTTGIIPELTFDPSTMMVYEKYDPSRSVKGLRK